MWNLPAPPGFVGFDPAGQVRIYVRDLPHWRQPGVTYFTTFRLEDALPATRLRELADLRAQWEQLHPPPRSTAQWQALARTTIEKVERWLDVGAGCCVLEQGFAADILEGKLRHFDGARYELGAYVIMPNHVHALVRLFSDELYPLEKLEQGWKGFRRARSTRHRQPLGNGGSASHTIASCAMRNICGAACNTLAIIRGGPGYSLTRRGAGSRLLGSRLAGSSSSECRGVNPLVRANQSTTRLKRVASCSGSVRAMHAAYATDGPNPSRTNQMGSCHKSSFTAHRPDTADAPTSAPPAQWPSREREAGRECGPIRGALRSE